jgi:hypothetical protein
VWSKSGPRARSGRAAALASTLLLVACASTPPPAKGGRVSAGARVVRALDPTDVFPADLDLVIRIDLARMRSGIGPIAADELSRRALREAEGDEIKQAFACAEVVWIGTRAATIDAGDHVVVLEGKQCLPELARARWQRVRDPNGGIAVFDRKGEAARAGTARIIDLGHRAVAFVSPVELDSVKRVLEAGPDAKRGSPTAEGVVSLDMRVHRLPPALEQKYPSIGEVLAGLTRVRGSAVLVDAGLKVDAQIVGASKEGAERAARFLEALRDNLRSPRYAAAAKAVVIEQVESTVRVRVVLPPAVVLAIFGGGPDDGK